MALFGSFETIDEAFSGEAYTVYSARRSGDPAEYAIKLFIIRAEGVDAESAEVLGPLLRDLENTCAERVSVQQKGAEASKNVAPIFERGQDDRGVWYATKFYPRSANLLITRKVELNGAAIQHIVHSVVQGALDLKRACGRSHGEINPTSIQISKDELTEAEVVLSDPLPGAPSEALRYEKADLRAIGELIYQLVMRQGTVDFQWILLPLESSPQWAATFGKKEGARWLELCSRLLDPNLSLERTNLESLAKELEPSGAGKGMVKIGAIAAAVVVLAAIAFFLLKRPSHGPSTTSTATTEGGTTTTTPGSATSETAVATPPPNVRFQQTFRTAQESFLQAAPKITTDITPDVVDKLLSAQTTIAEAITFEATNKSALELQQSIKSSLEDAYEGATNRAGRALQAANGGEHSTNYANLALRLKPKDDAASELMKQGLLQRAKELQGKDCNEARSQAEAADRDGNWADAKQKWERARELCKDNNVKEVSDGLKFAEAMINVETLLKEADSKAQSKEQGAQARAKQLCDDALKILASDEISVLAGAPPSRQSASNQQKNRAEGIRATAIKWASDQELVIKCEKLKADALDAEKKKEWAKASSKWHDVISTCGESTDAKDGAEFSSTMARIIQRMEIDKPGTAWSLASARSATNDYPQAVKDLDGLSKYTNGSAPRTAELEAKRSRALVLQSDGANAIADLARAANCNRAKTNALAAETGRKWLEASNQWFQAIGYCRDDPEPSKGLQFATNMLLATADLAASSQISLNDLDSAQRVKQSTALVDEKLRAAKSVASTPSRVAAVDEQTQRAQSLEKQAVAAIQRINTAKACQQAKTAALGAEAQTNWSLAAQNWDQATNFCPADPDVRNGITFTRGIVEASATVAQAQGLADKHDTTGQGAQLCETADKTLSALSRLDKTPVRSAGLSALKARVGALRLASDYALANALLSQGKYEEALKVCDFYNSEKSMSALKQMVTKEMGDSQTFTNLFNSGNYSYLTNQSYASKPPFSYLFTRGAVESGALDKINQAGGNWQAILDLYNNSQNEPYWSTKPPFRDALEKARNDQAAYKGQMAKAADDLDRQLVCLAMKLNVKGRDTNILPQPGRDMDCSLITADTLSTDEKTFYHGETARLRSAYTQYGILNEKARAAILKRIDGSIDR